MMRLIKVMFFLLFLFPALAFAAVNINTASKDELMSLKGIGEKRAQMIVDYRSANGGFKSVSELANIKGISSKTIEKLGDEISTQ